EEGRRRLGRLRLVPKPDEGEREGDEGDGASRRSQSERRKAQGGAHRASKRQEASNEGLRANVVAVRARAAASSASPRRTARAVPAALRPRAARRHPLQVFPSQPIDTEPPLKMTGTSRRPFDSLSISFMSAAFTVTFRYSTLKPCFAYASRAAIVCGHVSLPKIRTCSAISSSSSRAI